MRISAFESREIQGAILAVKGLPREVQAQIRKHSREISTNEWRTAMAETATEHLEQRVLVDTARVTVSNQNVTLTAGALAKKLPGGAKAHEVAHSAEFGADREYVGQASSATGKAYKRRTRRQFRPRNRKGYVAYPAAAQVIPRVASLWVQTVVRTVYEQLGLD